MRSFWLIASLLVCLTPAAQAADIRVVTAGFVSSAGLRELAEKFSTETGNRVTVDSKGMGQMMDTIRAGADDVVILPPDLMADAVAQTLVMPDTRQPLGRVEIGMIVPKGAAHPDLSTVASTAAAVKAAKWVAYANPFTDEKAQSAMIVYNILQRPDFKPNNGRPPSKGSTVAGIKEGADMALGLKSQSADPAVEYVGDLPASLNSFMDADIAIFAKATDAKVAAAFIAFLRTPASVEYFRSKGLDPR